MGKTFDCPLPIFSETRCLFFYSADGQGLAILGIVKVIISYWLQLENYRLSNYACAGYPCLTTLMQIVFLGDRKSI